ncbi:hypothetical protein [Macrococcus animalis]|uniref:hypothetical protein n=1 Tax=Macrococcus animalis TaxID=3395467 RepID=UPI0039BEBF06
MKLIGLVCILIFAGLWGFGIKKILPNDMIDGNNNKIDERTSKILLEVFSNTLVWVVYALLLNIILKLFKLGNPEKTMFPDYPEVFYLVLILVIFLMNLLYTKSKYSAKG